LWWSASHPLPTLAAPRPHPFTLPSSPPPEAAAGQARGAKDGGGGASAALPLRGEPRIWSGGSIGEARQASSRAGGGSGVPAARAAGSGGRWRPAAASAVAGARDLAPPLLPCSACGPAWSGRASLGRRFCTGGAAGGGDLVRAKSLAGHGRPRRRRRLRAPFPSLEASVWTDPLTSPSPRSPGRKP
jgi:hypothetical protein